MKEKIFIIIGGVTEFIEYYVRELNKIDFKIIVIDEKNEKIDEIKRYKKNNPKHFSNLIEEFYLIDSTEDTLEKIFNIVDKLKLKYNIAGILPVKEKLIIHSAILSKYLKLASVGIRAAIISRSKLKQREILKYTKWGVNFKKLSKTKLETEFPNSGVIKPINDHGSNNVYLWSNSNEKKEILKILGKLDSENFLIEEKIEGQEYSIESWVKNNEILYSSITKKITLKHKGIEFPVEIGHEVPYNQELEETIKNEIEEMNKYIIKETNVENAIVHLEFKIDGKNIPRVMEWAVRNPGDRIMDLYMFSGKINPYRLYIDILLDNKIESVKNNTKKAYQIYFNIDSKLCEAKKFKYMEYTYWPNNKNYNGFLKKEQGINLEKDIEIHEIGILLNPNTEIPEIKNSFSRHSYVVASTTKENEKEKIKIIEKFFYKNFLSSIKEKNETKIK